MNELANKIQLVINTLEILNVPSSHHNVNRMLGIYDTLFEVRNTLMSLAEKAEENEDGRETDAE